MRKFKKWYQKQIDKIKNYFAERKTLKRKVEELQRLERDNFLKIQSLKDRNIELSKDIGELKRSVNELEEFMATAKTLVKKNPASNEFEKKRKWLYSYPDETNNKK